jgi:hypothetical protein
MSETSALLGLGEGSVRGPSPSFEGVHLLFAFLTIGESGPIGRQALARQVGLGEGAIRTVLKKLQEKGYSRADPSGCQLTSRGQDLFSSVRKTLSPLVQLRESDLTLGESQAAVCVRGRSRSVRGGIEQRDSAIRVGATGATTYVIRRGKFTVPGGSEDCEKEFPGESWSQLRHEFMPREGDVVIVCGAEQQITARLGALAAAILLL